MDYYILNINNLKSINLEKDGKIIHSEEFEDGVVSKRKIEDLLFLKYLFNKTLASMTSEDALLVRYYSDENLFRYENVEGLKDKEVKNYVDYNLDDIFPDNENFYKKRFNYFNDQLFIYAIPSFMVEFIDGIISENKIKSSIMTSFTSEAISYIENIDEENFQILNIQKDFLELISFKDRKVVNYKNKKIYMYNLDLNDISDRDKLEEFRDLMMENINPDIKLYYFGDNDLINLFEISTEVAGINKSRLYFNIESYFMRENETSKLFRRK